MTQALINSLNIVSEKKVNLTNKTSKSSGMDFGKLFENKTGKIDKDNTESKSIKTDKDNNNDFKQENTTPQTTVNKNNTTDDTNTNKNTTKNTDETISDNTAETNELNTTEMTDNNTQQTEDKTTENKSKTSDNTDENELVAATEDDTDSTAITEEDSESEEEEITVTEEEPTMYNELITLDDTTALLLFQSQIQKTVTVNTENEQITTDENSTGTKNTTTRQNLNYTDTTNKDTEVLKQFDIQVRKGAEIINKTPAETTRPRTDIHKSSAPLSENIIKELEVEVLSSQSAETESSMGDLMQNQSPQEQAARVMIQGDIKYEAVASEVSKNITPAKTTTVTPGRIIEQITKQLEGMFNNSKLNMVLNPGSLGKLNLQLINTKDGILAQFTVTTQEARDALMKGLSGLKESLLANGVNIDNVSVRLENNEGETENDYTEQEGSRGGYKRQGEKREKDNGKNFEEMMFDLENESNV